MIPTGPNDPIFAGFDPIAEGNDYESKLPSATRELFATTLATEIEDLTANGGAQSALDISRIISGRLGLWNGIPNDIVDAFKSFFEAAAKVTGKQLLQATNQLVKTINKTLAETLTAIPILGIVIDLVMAVVDLVRLAIEAFKERKPPPGQALAYDQEQDAFKAQSIFTQAESMDWTSIFLPWGDDWSSERIEYAPGVLGQGRSFGVSPSSSRGCLPGLSECVGIYQFPFEVPPGLSGFGGALVNGKGGRGSPLTPLSTAGDLFPSTRQLALNLWQAALKPSVQMYYIDTRGIGSAWANYFGSLREWAEAQHPDDPGPVRQLSIQATVQASASKFAIQSGGGGSIGVVPIGTSRFARIKSLKKHGVTGPNYPLEALVASMTNQLTKRQWWGLGTLATAYANPDSVAFNDTKLAQRHADMKELLLDHPDVCKVELDMIPDNSKTKSGDSYKDAVEAAQARMHCFLGAQDIGLQKPKAHRAPLEDEPEPEADQGSPVGPTTGGGGGVVVAAIAAAIAGALALT